jgi:hypothetical protein
LTSRLVNILRPAVPPLAVLAFFEGDLAFFAGMVLDLETPKEGFLHVEIFLHVETPQKILHGKKTVRLKNDKTQFKLTFGYLANPHLFHKTH